MSEIRGRGGMRFYYKSLYDCTLLSTYLMINCRKGFLTYYLLTVEKGPHR
jgi:hypothetical protein